MSGLLSVVITAFNEGNEVRRTVESVRENTPSPHEIILVDDGSTDGCCDGCDAPHVQVVRHPQRIGVAFSRNSGCRFAQGDSVAFLDAHQRVGPGCLDACAALASDTGGIVLPEMRELAETDWAGYGADLALCPTHGYFVGRWRLRPPEATVTPITTMICPGYVMTREAYRRVKWIDALRGWGASEPAVAVKAFFAGVPILHFRGPQARHLFRSKFNFDNSWRATWWNHALVARVCFSQDTWENYWLPCVFQRFLTPQASLDLDSVAVLAEHWKFQAIKVRADHEFWTDLLQTDPPAEITQRPLANSGALQKEYLTCQSND
jgi:glycosyltransferase involved in cell wall biosynthesis